MNAKKIYRYEWHLYRALCNQEISNKTYINNTSCNSPDYYKAQIAIAARDSYHLRRNKFTGKVEKDVFQRFGITRRIVYPLSALP